MIPADLKTHKICLACGSNELELLVDFGNMPLAGGFMRREEILVRNISYPLRLARCFNCTLMQVLEIISPERIFTSYSYATSTTRSMLAHFSRMGFEIVKTYSAQGELVVEFGCNDGALIKPMWRAGAKTVGVDPSDVARIASINDGWTLINDFFNEETASHILRDHGLAKIVVGSNVFAHTEDLHTILRGALELMQEEGVFIIEIYYQGDLINKTQFDTIYHEHIYYHSLTSLFQLFSQHGLKIVDVQKLLVHSGSIRVIAAKNGSSHCASPRVEEMLEQEKDWDVAGFVENVLRFRSEFHQFIKRLKNEGKRIGAYGAAGRMTVLMNYCGLGTDLIDYVVDMSPLRYGRLVPGVLLPIVQPEVFHQDPLDYMIMTAWSYEAEILERERAYLKNGGRFIVPLPEVRVVGIHEEHRVDMGV